MKCLEAYLKESLNIDFESLDHEDIYACRDYNGISELLSQYFVYPNEKRLRLPALIEVDDHMSVADQCVSFLLSEKLYNNVFTYGYRLGFNESVGSALHCTDVNSCVALVKSTTWQLFRRLFGTQIFVDLIVNHSLFFFNGDDYLQVTGNRINSPYRFEPIRQRKLKDLQKDTDVPVQVRSFLYKNSSNFKYDKLLSPYDGCESLREKLIEGCPVPIGSTIICGLDTALRGMLTRHRKIKYFRIFESLCPKRKLGSHLDAQTPTDEVLKFIIVVLEKLVAEELFGSKKNKAVLFRFVARMLKLPIRGSLRIDEIVARMKVKDFRIFRPQGGMFSRQDFERAGFLMRSFVSWLFKTLLPALISTFFYCTEISSSVTIHFFRHDTWNEISLPFLQTYLDKFMIENTKCRNHESYTLSKFSHNRVRIVPKKGNGEFRLIAIPMKGADDEEYKAFKQNFRNVICPIQCVLEHLRSRRKTHFEKLYSVNQITIRLREFKTLLLNKYGEIPKLHYLKFDINSCYDFIPREKVMSVIRNTLMNDTGFFVRSRTFYDAKKGTLKVRNVVNGNWKAKRGEVLIDNVRTSYISVEDLINAIMTELFQSALSFGGKCYLRKHGLFQGTSLSALLVDLVYDELLEHYDTFHSSKEDDTIVLRLADDFLVLSTSESRILRARKKALDGFAEFNADVNKSKLVSSVNEEFVQKLSFCALDIEVRTMEIIKSPESLVVADIRGTTKGTLYKRLLRVFEARLSYGTTHPLINSSAAILGQLELLASNVAESFLEAFRAKQVKVVSFSAFFQRLIVAATNACCEFNEDDVLAVRSHLAIANGFLTVLSRRSMKFQEVMKFLQCYCIELLRSATRNS